MVVTTGGLLCDVKGLDQLIFVVEGITWHLDDRSSPQTSFVWQNTVFKFFGIRYQYLKIGKCHENTQTSSFS